MTSPPTEPADRAAPQDAGAEPGHPSAASDPPTGRSLGQEAATGAVWVTAQKWAARITGFATIAILTRLVTPTEFGVVATASTVLPLIALLSDLGFSTYVVQAVRTDQRMLSTGFWFSASAGAVIGLAIIGAAPLLGDVLALPAVVPVLQVMVVSVLATVLASVPVALLRRRMAFRLVAVQNIIGAFAGQVVAVALALTGSGVWALVAQTVVTQVVTCALAWRSARWLPSLQFSVPQFRGMIRFGSSVLVADLVAMARSWAETAIVLTALGPATLGYLSVAQRLIQVAQDLGASAVLSVSTVVFAKVRESVERLRAAYLRSLSITYTAVAPGLVFVAVAATTLVPFAFGDGWSASVPATRALAVAGILTLGAGLDNGLFYGAGRPGVWLGYAFATDALTVAATAIAVRWGLAGVAVGFVVVASLATVARWFLVARQFGLTVAQVSRPLGLCLLVGALSAAAGVGTQVLSASWPRVAELALTGVVVVVVAVAATRLISPAVYHDTAELLRLRERAGKVTGRLRRGR